MNKPHFRQQDAPFCIQIELTKGCNLQCSFCGINGFQDKPATVYKFMTVEMAELVSKRIAESKWNPRLEFARRGEPTMNQDFHEIIAIFRKHNPNLRIMMTSNGGGFLRGSIVDNVIRLFESGLNVLALDDYKNVKIVPKIKQALQESNVFNMFLHDNKIRVFNYPMDKEGNPHQRSKTNFISFVEDITIANEGTHAVLNNHAGFGGPMKSYLKPCAKPFREMGINWDGSIDVCCVDWLSEYQCGSVEMNTLEEIWQNDRFNAMRQKLLLGDRSSRPCQGCDHPSYRVGLLPDKKGKETLPEPSEWTEKVIAEVLAEGPRIKPASRALQNVFPHLNEELQKVWENAGNS